MSTITVEIDDRRGGIGREEVLAWEDRRIDAAAAKLGVPAPRRGLVAERREALLMTKLDLGADEITRRLSRDTRWAGRLARVQAGISARRRTSVAQLHVDAGSAGGFVSWFERASRDVDQSAMLRACPDHFVLRPDSTGQEVIETTGGSPLASRFVVDYDDVSGLVTPPSPTFPHQVAGVARVAGGAVVGGGRHQFRDTERGFHARLTVELPLTMLPSMLAEHRWHLACEFSNWVEAADRSIDA